MSASSPAPRAPRRLPRIHWPWVLTYVRVALAVPVVVLTLRQTVASSWIAFGAFAVAALTDGLDGFTARRYGLVSSAGQQWDPIADKILVLVSMAALVVVGRFPLWAALLIVVREIGVTALRFAASRRGRVFGASRAGKAKTGVQLLAVLLFILPGGTIPGWIEQLVLALAVALTLFSGLQYAARARQLLADDES